MSPEYIIVGFLLVALVGLAIFSWTSRAPEDNSDIHQLRDKIIRDMRKDKK